MAHAKIKAYDQSEAGMARQWQLVTTVKRTKPGAAQPARSDSARRERNKVSDERYSKRDEGKQAVQSSRRK